MSKSLLFGPGQVSNSTEYLTTEEKSKVAQIKEETNKFIEDKISMYKNLVEAHKDPIYRNV